MNEYLQISHKMLASKQASKFDSIIYNGRAVCPDEVSPCLAGAYAPTKQGLFVYLFEG
jgi:hypothetical protein